jgi:two-component system KDP operon response regulator KdpE
LKNTTDSNSSEARILIVDDDPEIHHLVSISLQNQGYEVIAAFNGFLALDLIVQAKPQLVLLDLNLPEMSGLEVIKNIREKLGISSTALPVIFLSAQDEEESKVQALDLGADDYLTKPFSIKELLARVRTALRRVAELKNIKQTFNEPGRYFRAGRLEIDITGRVVIVDSKEIRMTPTEFSLLEYLIQNVGKVLTHRQLLQKVWGQNYGSESEYLRTFIKQLRRKIEPDPANPIYILTEPGVGYRFKA